MFENPIIEQAFDFAYPRGYIPLGVCVDTLGGTVWPTGGRVPIGVWGIWPCYIALSTGVDKSVDETVEKAFTQGFPVEKPVDVRYAFVDKCSKKSPVQHMDKIFQKTFEGQNRRSQACGVPDIAPNDYKTAVEQLSTG